MSKPSRTNRHTRLTPRSHAVAPRPTPDDIERAATDPVFREDIERAFCLAGDGAGLTAFGLAVNELLAKQANTARDARRTAWNAALTEARDAAEAAGLPDPDFLKHAPSGPSAADHGNALCGSQFGSRTGFIGAVTCPDCHTVLGAPVVLEMSVAA